MLRGNVKHRLPWGLNLWGAVYIGRLHESKTTENLAKPQDKRHDADYFTVLSTVVAGM